MSSLKSLDVSAKESLYYFLVTASKDDIIRERGWMLANDANELVDWAKALGYSIDMIYLGEADMDAFFPKVKHVARVVRNEVVG